MDTTCIEVRRELTTDPQTRDADILQHLSGCNDCAGYLKDIRLFDSKLASAIKVEVPEGLESRILLAQRMSPADTDNVHTLKSRTTTSNSFKWMSLAAGIVLAIGLTIGTFKLGESHGLEKQVLAHVYHELDILEKDDNIQLAALNAVLKQHGIQANAGIGHVRHATNCPFGDKVAPHIVLDDDNGKAVTVMYIPWEDSFKRMPFDDERFNGVLFGAEQGSIAIVSEDPESLEAMEYRLMNSLETRI